MTVAEIQDEATRLRSVYAQASTDRERKAIRKRYERLVSKLPAEIGYRWHGKVNGDLIGR